MPRSGENIYMISKAHHGEVEDCVVFGLASITGRPIPLSHELWKNGAVFYRLPISAFYTKEDLSQRTFLGLGWTSWSFWNCFSYYPAVTSYDILDGQSGNILIR